jgi:hypothetical protein
LLKNSQKHLYLIAIQFIDVLRNFHEKGSVLDAEQSGTPSKLNNMKLMDISDSMLWSPSKSLRKLAQEKDIGLATAHKVVREILNLIPYKVTSVQELKLADHEKRSHYCEWYRSSWTSLPHLL